MKIEPLYIDGTLHCRECEKAIAEHPFRQRKFCDRQCKSLYQKRARPVSREWLYQKYVVERLDCTQIAKIVNRDSKSVWNWLKDLGIETRKRGTNTAVHFKPGEPSRWRGHRHTEETKEKIRQIAIAQGRVPFDPAIGSYMKGKKGAETPGWKGGITPERQDFYGSREWKRVARAVWVRDSATCQRCGRRKNDDRSVSFDIHHIVGFACRELRAELSNLVLLCEPCHYWIHSSANVDEEFIRDVEDGTSRHSA